MNINSYRLSDNEANPNKTNMSFNTCKSLMLSKTVQTNKEEAIARFKTTLNDTKTNMVIGILMAMNFVPPEFIDCLVEFKDPSAFEVGDKNGLSLLMHVVKRATDAHQTFFGTSNVKGRSWTPETWRQEFSCEVSESLLSSSISAERMIDLGANINGYGKFPTNDTTALDIALSGKFSPMIRMLVSKGAKALAVCEDKTQSSEAEKALENALQPLVNRIQLLSSTGLFPDLVNFISSLLIKSCTATFNFPEEQSVNKA